MQKNKGREDTYSAKRENSGEEGRGRNDFFKNN